MERLQFETALQELKSQLLTMGGLVESQIHRAVQALIHRSEAEARKVVASDAEVNLVEAKDVRHHHVE